jgi:hypothetical protein
MGPSVLRPDPARGNVLAAASVALALTVFFLNERFDSSWGAGIHLLYSALAALLIVGLAFGAPRAGGRPPAWLSTLFVASYPLVLAALGNLADLVGSDEPFGATGTFTWVGLLLAVLMFAYATSFDSGISTLLGAVTLVIVGVTFVDWAFSPDGATTFRWVLLLLALALGAAGAARRASAEHHAVGFVNAAGLAVLGIAITYAIESFGLFLGDGSSAHGATGWELVLLAGGAALLCYAAVARQSGPGYVGAANLVAFFLLASSPGGDGPSLIGWPLVLLIVTAALLAAGLRRGDAATPAAAPGD